MQSHLIAGLRPDSLYYKSYFSLRQPLIDLLFEGVKWDKESAREEKIRLENEKDSLHPELDRLSGAIRLYPVHKRRSEELRDLLAEQRTIRAARKSVGARSVEGKELGLQLKQIIAFIRECRESGRDVEFEAGTSLSGKSLGEFFYGKGEGTLRLPARMKLRKDSGKRTVTVDEVALLKLRQAFGERELPSGEGKVKDLIGMLLKFRDLDKRISTYLNDQKLCSPVDGRFHSQYKPHGTQTLRLSSGSDPWSYGGNAQNLHRSLKWLMLPD